MMSDAPPGYDPRAYPPFAVTADIVLFTIRKDALEVLLIERGGEPWRGAWALPGGFVRPDEDIEEAAARELAEETGLAGGAWHLEQLGAYGAPDRDPRMRVVTVAHWAVCAGLPTPPRSGSDAVAAGLMPVERIESGALRLAFDHERIVRDAVERLRSRLEHTALAAAFCPPEFTIRQLRRVYETVWGAPLDPGNFQRYVRESGAFEQRAAPPGRVNFDRDANLDSQRHEARSMFFEQRAGPPAPADFDRRPERGRPASLWAARRTEDGRPATAARTLARPQRPSPDSGSIPPGAP